MRAAIRSLRKWGCCNTGFLTTTLSQLRATQPSLPIRTPNGVTGVNIYQLMVSGTTGVHLEH